MAVFWNIVSCSPVDTDELSKEITGKAPISTGIKLSSYSRKTFMTLESWRQFITAFATTRLWTTQEMSFITVLTRQTYDKGFLALYPT